MFQIFSGVGRLLLNKFGDSVEYSGELATGVTNPIIAIIDRDNLVEDPGRGGGVSVVSKAIFGYVSKEDIVKPKRGDIIEYNDEKFKVLAFYPDDSGLWRLNLIEEREDD